MRGHGAAGTMSLGGWVVFVMLVLTVGGGAATAGRNGAQPALAGVWRLDQTTGELPDQAARALDGETDARRGMTIRIEQTDASIEVRRLGGPEVLLRAMSFVSEAPSDGRKHGNVLRGHAEWRDGALLANGHITGTRGFIKRQVPVEELWSLEESGRALRVTTTLKTPLGVKRRTQVFVRATSSTPTGEPDSPDRPAGPE